MPALIATANAPELHETFADFGPTVFRTARDFAKPNESGRRNILPAAKCRAIW